jgi:polyribonucleotide nucleotidyltransferase
MDFKVTGTKNGIVAVQMDLKINGLSYEVLTNALNQAKDGRLHILGEMAKTITALVKITNHTLRVLLPSKLIKNLLVQLSGPVVKSSRKCNAKPVLPSLSRKKTTRV